MIVMFAPVSTKKATSMSSTKPLTYRPSASDTSERVPRVFCLQLGPVDLVERWPGSPNAVRFPVEMAVCSVDCQKIA